MYFRTLISSSCFAVAVDIELLVVVVVIVAILAMVFVVEVVQVSPHSFWEPFVQKMYCPLNLVYCSSPLGKGSFVVPILVVQLV